MDAERSDTADQRSLIISRVEAIDQTGRVFVRMNVEGVVLSLQDDGRTLKIFYRDREAVTNG